MHPTRSILSTLVLASRVLGASTLPPPATATTEVWPSDVWAAISDYPTLWPLVAPTGYFHTKLSSPSLIPAPLLSTDIDPSSNDQPSKEVNTPTMTIAEDSTSVDLDAHDLIGSICPGFDTNNARNDGVTRSGAGRLLPVFAMVVAGMVVMFVSFTYTEI